MIRFVDSEGTQKQLKAVLAGDDFLHACLLHTPYRALGVQKPNLAQFWVVCRADETPVGALLRQPDECILCDGGLGEEEQDEVAALLRFLDCDCLCARYELLERIYAAARLPHPVGSKILRGNGAAGEKSARVRPVFEHLRPLFTLILENYGSYTTAAGYEHWLSQQRLRMKDGVCGIYAIYEGEHPIATASFTAASGRCVDVGTVVVQKERRDRGLGRELVRHLTATAGERALEPILCCATPELEDYYRRLGFVPYDRWGVCGGFA